MLRRADSKSETDGSAQTAGSRCKYKTFEALRYQEENKYGQENPNLSKKYGKLFL